MEGSSCRTVRSHTPPVPAQLKPFENELFGSRFGPEKFEIFAPQRELCEATTHTNTYPREYYNWLFIQVLPSGQMNGNFSIEVILGFQRADPAGHLLNSKRILSIQKPCRKTGQRLDANICSFNAYSINSAVDLTPNVSMILYL